LVYAADPIADVHAFFASIGARQFNDAVIDVDGGSPV
jgi:hypothetical protein